MEKRLFSPLLVFCLAGVAPARRHTPATVDIYGLLALQSQMRRAMRVDPMVALRYE